MWGHVFMAGSGKKSETNEPENKYTCRYKRLIMLVDLKHAGRMWNGYTDWTNAESFLMDCQMSPQQKLMMSPCCPPFPLASANSCAETLDGRKWAQHMCLPTWVSTSSALEDALLVSWPSALNCWHPTLPTPRHLINQYTKIWEIFLVTTRIKFIQTGAACRKPCRRVHHQERWEAAPV